MTVSDEEIKTRSLAFLICILGGMFLLPAGLWLYTLLLQTLEATESPLPVWIANVLGIGFAILPTIVLIQFARKWLHQRYPDSPARKIPPP